MIKMLLVALILVMVGCADGGKECPDMDTTLYYSLSNDSIVMEMMGRGELAKGGGEGVHTIWACLAKPSTTVYVDPKVTVS